MVKFGLISDTHINIEDDSSKIKSLMEQLRNIFKNVDEIIHAGDVCDEGFLKMLQEIAPTKCVRGNMDVLDNLEDFIRFSVGKYNIGIIHKPPKDFDLFFREHHLHILIHGHTHQPIIKAGSPTTLILNPGSPTFPVAPPSKKGFDSPIARPSVMTLEIDVESDIISTYTINLKF